MKKLLTIAIVIFLFLILCNITFAQTPREQLKQMVAQLQTSPGDNALREKIIKFAAAMKPAPAIPEEANRAYVKGGVFKLEAKDVTGYDLAISAFREAVRVAPWWGDAYFNLGVTLGLAGKYDEGIASLKLSILSAPAGSAEARDAQNRIYAIEAKAEIASKTPRKNSIGMELVYVPPGDFMMGSDNGDADEKPVHRVTISQGFWMGKYEVTQSQYEGVVGKNPSYFKGCSNCPLETVSWDDAREFISQLNANNDGFIYSLPTEAQWEYAARAGTTGLYAGNLDDMAWYNKNSDLKTHPVGTKQPNAFGLYDMHGNVWEWCEDWYGSYSATAATDPTGPSSGTYRVVRGGAGDDYANYARSANRYGNDPTVRDYSSGFRVAARPR